ncbi:energy transducer TonB family protein [Pseudooceanicola algae]|uniref:energy transducer TonB family protein n=1 Tax=Pseudooceanicola algae TaxID=1537215 RepID=UPI000E6D3160|nr:TonB family protein [Pseudooceanicola algae]
MKRLAEIAAFLALAIGLHVAFAIRIPSKDGADAGGQGGAALVTLQGAPPGTVDMVERWETPPEMVSEPVVEEMVQEAALTPPTPTRPVTPVAPRPAFPMVTLPDAMPETAALPKVETDVPPPPEPEPEVEPDPEPEPEPEEVAEPLPEPEPEVTPEPEPQVAEEAPSEMVPDTSRRPQARPRDFTPRVVAREEPRPEKAEDGPRQQAARAGGSGGATQQAAGSGGSQQAGQNNGQVRAGAGKDAARLEAVWGGQIRNRIERRKRFPGGMRGKQGRVVVRITVSRDGNVMGARVVRSSGEAVFDQEAMKAIQRAGRMPSAPAGLSQASYTFTLPMDFS